MYASSNNARCRVVLSYRAFICGSESPYPSNDTVVPRPIHLGSNSKVSETQPVIAPWREFRRYLRITFVLIKSNCCNTHVLPRRKGRTQPLRRKFLWQQARDGSNPRRRTSQKPPGTVRNTTAETPCSWIGDKVYNRSRERAPRKAKATHRQ